MNTLSWTLYLVDVIYSAASFFTFLCVVSILVGVCYLFVCAVRHTPPHFGYEDEEEAKVFFSGGWKKLLPLITYPLIVLFFLQLVPSKETAYLILASEAGEYAATTEDGEAIISDLKEIIQVQLDNLKEHKSDK